MSAERTAKHFRTEFPINRTKNDLASSVDAGSFFGFAGDPLCLLQNGRSVFYESCFDDRIGILHDEKTSSVRD